MKDSFRLKFQTLIEDTRIPANASKELVEESWNKILKAVVSNMPKSLFRYRSVSEFSISSFRDGTITVCHPSMFPDKYDSWVYANTDDKYLLGEIRKLLPLMREYGIKVSPDEINSFIAYIQKRTMAHRDYLKSNPSMRIACLSERVDSKFMWDCYGGGYKGFALEYDTMRLFVHAGMSEDPINIFPVIYTKERLDSTNDVLYAAAWDLVPQNNPTILAIMEKMCQGPDQLYWYRSYLYKSEDEYSREKEWRLIHSNKDSSNHADYLDIPDYNSVIGIYYGPDISTHDRQVLHEVAKRRGIDEYDIIVSNSPSYSLEVVKI